MFGKNQPAKNLGNLPGLTLSVAEIFYSIQGEGPSAGTPAVFIRLAGCNLRCHFCDTDFEPGAKEMTVTEILDEMGEAVKEAREDRPLVVITGGEPLRQNIAPLLYALINDHCRRIEIETAGTLMPLDTSHAICLHPNTITIICSPKTYHLHPLILAICHTYKYVVAEGDWCLEDGAPTTDTQSIGRATRLHVPRPLDTVFVQPREEYIFDPTGTTPPIPDREKTLVNHAYAAKIALRWGYRISIQLHKILGLR